MLNITKTSLAVLLSFLVPLFFTDLSTAGKKDKEDQDKTVLGVEFGNDDKSGSEGDSKSGNKGDDKSGGKGGGKSGGKDDDDDSSNNPGGGGGKDDDKSGSVPASGGKGGGKGGGGGGGGTSAVPEPATVLLLGLGGAAIGIRKLMRKLKSQC